MPGNPFAKLFRHSPQDCTAETEWKPSDRFINKNQHKYSKQCQKLNHGPEQTENDEGGCVYAIDDWTKLNRFLQLGTDQCNRFSMGEQNMLRTNASCIDRLIAIGKGPEVVTFLKDASYLGETPKLSLILFALAICARSNNKETKEAAYGALNDTCRTPTHLFLLIKLCDYVETKPLDDETANKNKQKPGPKVGWGRAHKRAICAWYEHQAAKGPLGLARLLTKYRRRSGYTHKDVFRQAHIKPEHENLKVMARYIVKGLEKAEELVSELKEEYPELESLLKFLQAIEELKSCTEEVRTAELVREFRLEREHVHTSMLQSKIVWEALAETMNRSALLKHLNKLTALDLLAHTVGGSKTILDHIEEAFTDSERLGRARIHPFAILQAHRVYRRGQKLYHAIETDKFRWFENSEKPTNTEKSENPNNTDQTDTKVKRKKSKPKKERKCKKWVPDSKVLKILDISMYKAFENHPPMGKRCLIAIDADRRGAAACFGNSAVTPLDAAAAFALMMLKKETEENCLVVTFADHLKRLNIKKDSTMDDAMKEIALTTPGTIDCALPMLWATKKGYECDAFIVITGNQTYFGAIHPSEALKKYNEERRKKKPAAKLVVIATAVNEFSIADPDQPNTMMDVAGFDWKAFSAISEFIVSG